MKTCVAGDNEVGCAAAVLLQAANVGGAVASATAAAPLKASRRRRTAAPAPSAPTQVGFRAPSGQSKSVSATIATTDGLREVLQARLPAGTRCTVYTGPNGNIRSVAVKPVVGGAKVINYSDLVNYLRFEEYVSRLPGIQRDPSVDAAFFKQTLQDDYPLAFEMSKHPSLRKLAGVTLDYVRDCLGSFSVSVEETSGKTVLATDATRLGTDELIAEQPVKLQPGHITKMLNAVFDVEEQYLSVLLSANAGLLAHAYGPVLASEQVAAKKLTAAQRAQFDTVDMATELSELLKTKEVEDVLKKADRFASAKSYLSTFVEINKYFDLLSNVANVQQALGLPVQLLPATERGAFAKRMRETVFTPYTTAAEPVSESVRNAAVRVYAAMNRTNFMARANQAKVVSDRLLNASAFVRYAAALHEASVPAKPSHPTVADTVGNHTEAHELEETQYKNLHARMLAAWKIFSKDAVVAKVVNADEE